MNKERRSIIFEIVSVILIMLIVIPIFNNKINSITSNRDDLTGLNPVKLNITDKNNSTYDKLYNKYIVDGLVLEASNTSDDMVKYQLIFEMKKVGNVDDYSVLLNGSLYKLSNLLYYSDDNYWYFNLDEFYISNKNQQILFEILLDDTTNYENESIEYRFSTMSI